MTAWSSRTPSLRPRPSHDVMAEARQTTKAGKQELPKSVPRPKYTMYVRFTETSVAVPTWPKSLEVRVYGFRLLGFRM